MRLRSAGQQIALNGDSGFCVPGCGHKPGASDGRGISSPALRACVICVAWVHSGFACQALRTQARSPATGRGIPSLALRACVICVAWVHSGFCVPSMRTQARSRSDGWGYPVRWRFVRACAVRSGSRSGAAAKPGHAGARAGRSVAALRLVSFALHRRIPVSACQARADTSRSASDWWEYPVARAPGLCHLSPAETEMRPLCVSRLFFSTRCV